MAAVRVHGRRLIHHSRGGGRELDWHVVANVLTFIVNIAATMLKGRRMTTTSCVLFFGLLISARLDLPGMIPTEHQTIDSYWRWRVVHPWVEGVWEPMMGGIIAFLLIKLTGIDREVIEKWLQACSALASRWHSSAWPSTPARWPTEVAPTPES